MKISTKILKDLNACNSGFNDFKAVHGDDEIMFSDCVKSESNLIGDYFWFIRKQSLSDSHKKDLQLLAIEFAERVLPIFENRYPDDKRPRTAIDATKLYLSGKSTFSALKEVRRTDAYNAAADAYNAADAAYNAADDSAADAYNAAAAAAAAAYAADAADAADAAYNAAADSAADADAERSWQKQRLAELMVKWGW